MICRIVAPSGVIAPKLDQLVKRELVLLELTNGECRAIDGQRRCDDVDARAIRQAGVADRAGFIDAATNLADDALADRQKLAVVTEADLRIPWSCRRLR